MSAIVAACVCTVLLQQIQLSAYLRISEKEKCWTDHSYILIINFLTFHQFRSFSVLDIFDAPASVSDCSNKNCINFYKNIIIFYLIGEYVENEFNENWNDILIYAKK